MTSTLPQREAVARIKEQIASLIREDASIDIHFDITNADHMADDIMALVSSLQDRWRPIETAPKEHGAQFFAWQDGEVYVVRVGDEPDNRWAWRTHGRRTESEHRIIDAEMDGKAVKAAVLINERDIFEHNWTLWTKGFDFVPTHWMPLPPIPSSLKGSDVGEVGE
jgi:hypothetical protein